MLTILNHALIIGLIFTLIGGVFTGLGTWHSSRIQEGLNKRLGESINKQNEKDRPIIDVTGGNIKDGRTVNIKITNSGERLAEKVTLEFKSHPNKFAESTSISLQKILANGTVVNIYFDVFQSQLGQHMTGESKDNWESFLNEFKEGKKSLVTHFYITYEYEGKQYKTGDYVLLYDGKNIFHISNLN